MKVSRIALFTLSMLVALDAVPVMAGEMAAADEAAIPHAVVVADAGVQSTATETRTLSWRQARVLRRTSSELISAMAGFQDLLDSPVTLQGDKVLAQNR